MARQGGSRHRKRAPALSEPVGVPLDALRLLLDVPGFTLAQLAAADKCPVPLHSKQTQEQQQQLALQLESWSQLPAVLAWFGSTVLQLQPAAKLGFPPCLPKELRADVHKLVTKKLSAACQSVSEGLGEERYVAVVAKGTLRPAARRMTAEQQDHAMALWLLWKQQRRVQQQQQPDASQGQPQHTATEKQPEQQPEQPTRAVALDELAALSLQDDAASSSAASAEQQQQQQLDVGQQVYSRDEVEQMLVQGQLTAELAELWEGPKGVEQRHARQMCLAAAGGELADVQELISAHPGLVPLCVHDLSAGGALPLQLAAAGGYVDVVQLLLAAGAPLEAKDGKGLTALQVAQRSEQCDVEAVLMQAGAVNKQRDAWGTLDMPGGFL